MKQIKFLGAAGTVTGSSYVLTGSSGTNLMVDLGMFQGTKEIEKLNFRPIDFDVSKIDIALLTHAHLDHCGRLPLLTKNGFGGNIYMNQPTMLLAEVVMYDSAKISSIENPDNPLYMDHDVSETISRIKLLDYGKVLEFKEFQITFRNAGHILGSASIEVLDKGGTNYKKIVFSGDLGNTPEEIVKPTEFIDQADVVIMESTYGDRVHPPGDARKILQEEINVIEKSGGVLLIPSFSIERTQVILHMIKNLKFKNLVDKKTPVYMDSPMAIHATEIYKKYKNLYNKHLYKISQKTDPFDFPGLKIVHNSAKSKAISKAKYPRVIIAGSGMMNGGRIVGHAARNLSDPKTRLLIAGYQGEETLGREIVEGAKTVIIDEKEITINAHVGEIYSLSAHADQPRLLEWLSRIKDVKKVFLSHGEDGGPRETLRDQINSRIGINDISLPKINDTFFFS